MVARRAAELALAAGVDLPGRPGALAAGRRPAGRRRRCPASPRSSGGCSRARSARATRRRQGAHFTPRVAGGGARGAGARRADACQPSATRPVAAARCCWPPRATSARRGDGIARASWRGCGRPTSIRSPSRPPRPPWPCGRVHRHRRSTSPSPTRCSTTCGWPPLDVVVGNPPFLSQLGADDRPRRRPTPPGCASGSATPCGAYTDPAALFLLRACDLAAPGGTVALLQPQSVAGGPRRRRRARGGRRRGPASRRSGSPSRPASTRPSTCASRSSRSGAAGRRCAVERAPGPRPRRARRRRSRGRATRRATRRRPPPGSAASTTAWSSTCTRATTAPTGVPLVTTGMIDLGRVAWGERPARIGGRAWDAAGRRRRRARGPGGATGSERTGGPKLRRGHPDPGGRGRRRRRRSLDARRAARRGAGARRAAVAAGGGPRRAGGDGVVARPRAAGPRCRRAP